MITYSMDEIKNKHGQPIYYFSKQNGNTELEKCINFMDQMNMKYILLNSMTINSGDITCVLADRYCQVFNDLGEKVGEFEIDYIVNDIRDMYDDLDDIGFQLI